MAELSERSGVPVSTIKWWRREGLLPPGRSTAPNQAEYDGSHVARLRLLTVLRDLVDLPTARIAEIVDVLDQQDASLHDAVGAAHRALTPPGEQPGEAARTVVDDLLADLDWDLPDDTPARLRLAGAVEALADLGREVTADGLRLHAEAAATVARAEVEATPIDRPRDEVVTDVVVGTILYGQVLQALRLLAHEEVSARRWGS